MVSSGSWDPRPLHEEPTEPDEWDEAVRNGGTSALVDLFKNEDGARPAQPSSKHVASRHWRPQARR